MGGIGGKGKGARRRQKLKENAKVFDKKTGSKVDEQLFELREASQTFSFSGTVTGSPDDYVVSLLRGFSAPVTAKQASTQDELLFLASNDDDSLNQVGVKIRTVTANSGNDAEGVFYDDSSYDEADAPEREVVHC